MKNKILLTLVLFSFNVMPSVELYSQMYPDGTHEEPDDRYWEDGYHRENSKTNPLTWVVGAGIIGFLVYLAKSEK